MARSHWLARTCWYRVWERARRRALDFGRRRRVASGRLTVEVRPANTTPEIVLAHADDVYVGVARCPRTPRRGSTTGGFSGVVGEEEEALDSRRVHRGRACRPSASLERLVTERYNVRPRLYATRGAPRLSRTTVTSPRRTPRLRTRPATTTSTNRTVRDQRQCERRSRPTTARAPARPCGSTPVTVDDAIVPTRSGDAPTARANRPS